MELQQLPLPVNENVVIAQYVMLRKIATVTVMPNTNVFWIRLCKCIT